jgi:AcrR family transcriptional regulator
LNRLAVPEHLQLRKQPKQKRTHALIDKILQSAAILLQQDGYHALTTNAIAQHAGVDIKSLYEFFPNKESIIYSIADQWLYKLREINNQFEAPEFVELPWREFFKRLYQMVFKDASYRQNIISLNGLWAFLPDFTQLDNYQRNYLCSFYVSQFQRFGAQKTEAQLKAIALFLIALEDGLGGILSDLEPSQTEALWQLQYETLCFHLEKILD